MVRNKYKKIILIGKNKQRKYFLQEKQEISENKQKVVKLKKFTLRKQLKFKKSKNCSKFCHQNVIIIT